MFKPKREVRGRLPIVDFALVIVCQTHNDLRGSMVPNRIP